MMIYLIIALLVCSGLSVGLVWRREHDLFYRQQHEATHALSISDARYRRLFEAARDGILILDAETGMVVDVNPFLVEMLGYSREQFFGKRIWELGFFRDVVASKLNFTELQRGHTRRIHSGCGSQSGQFRPELLMCLPLSDLSPHSLECPTLRLTSI